MQLDSVKLLWFRRGSIRGIGGNEHEKGTALPKFTLHPDFASMQFGDRADNCQTQPGAALGARFTLAASEVLFKEAREIRRSNTDAGILHFELETLWSGFNPQGDSTMLGSVLNCILHQVINRLLDLGRIDAGVGLQVET